jgi:hypothetical protein
MEDIVYMNDYYFVLSVAGILIILYCVFVYVINLFTPSSNNIEPIEGPILV